MDHRDDLREFLTSRRSRLTPGEVGLPDFGGRRRVKGLRRAPQRPTNAAGFTFLDPRAETFYRDWPGNARQIVALLRAEAGRSPHDRVLTDLTSEPDLQLLAFSAPPGSASRDGLRLLATWAATAQLETTTQTDPRQVGLPATDPADRS